MINSMRIIIDHSIHQPHKSFSFLATHVHQTLLYQRLVLLVQHTLRLDLLYLAIVILLRKHYQLINR